MILHCAQLFWAKTQIWIVGDHRTKHELRDRKGVRIYILTPGAEAKKRRRSQRTRELTDVCVCCASQALRPLSSLTGQEDFRVILQAQTWLPLVPGGQFQISMFRWVSYMIGRSIPISIEFRMKQWMTVVVGSPTFSFRKPLVYPSLFWP